MLQDTTLQKAVLFEVIQTRLAIITIWISVVLATLRELEGIGRIFIWRDFLWRTCEEYLKQVEVDIACGK